MHGPQLPFTHARLPGAGALATGLPSTSGSKAKSVSSLLSKNPPAAICPPNADSIEVVIDTAWSCYSSPTSMAAFEILRATRGGLGESSRRHLLEMNSAIGQLGRLITTDPANAGVAEVIWATLRGVVLAQMVTGTAVLGASLGAAALAAADTSRRVRPWRRRSRRSASPSI